MQTKGRFWSTTTTRWTFNSLTAVLIPITCQTLWMFLSGVFLLLRTKLLSFVFQLQTQWLEMKKRNTTRRLQLSMPKMQQSSKTRFGLLQSLLSCSNCFEIIRMISYKSKKKCLTTESQLVFFKRALLRSKKVCFVFLMCLFVFLMWFLDLMCFFGFDPMFDKITPFVFCPFFCSVSSLVFVFILVCFVLFEQFANRLTLPKKRMLETNDDHHLMRFLSIKDLVLEERLSILPNPQSLLLDSCFVLICEDFCSKKGFHPINKSWSSNIAQWLKKKEKSAFFLHLFVLTQKYPRVLRNSTVVFFSSFCCFVFVKKVVFLLSPFLLSPFLLSPFLFGFCILVVQKTQTEKGKQLKGFEE